MGVHQNPDGYTPVCNACGVSLCWDISDEDYEDQKKFWDRWHCRTCDPNAVGSRKRWREARPLVFHVTPEMKAHLMGAVERAVAQLKNESAAR